MFQPPYINEKIDGQYFIEMHPTEPKVIGYGKISANNPSFMFSLKYERIHDKPIEATRNVDMMNMRHFLTFETRDAMLNALTKFGIAPCKDPEPVEELIEELIVQIRERQNPNKIVPCPRCMQLNLCGCNMCNGKGHVTQAMATAYHKYYKGIKYPSYGENRRVGEFLDYYRNGKPDDSKEKTFVKCPRCKHLGIDSCNLCGGKGKVTQAIAEAYHDFFCGNYPERGDHSAQLEKFDKWYHNRYKS